VTAATTGMPYRGDTEIVTALTSQVLDAVDDDGGQVVIDAPFTMGGWWARGVVLQLERQGVDVRATEPVLVPGEHRRYGGQVQAWLVFVRDRSVETLREDPDMELVASWSGPPTGTLGVREVAVFLDTNRSDRVMRPPR
jgi:hypothetical protein